MARFKRLMITGAAGNLGRVLRRGLAHLADRLLLTGREPMDPPADHDETVVCELSDLDAVAKLMEGVDAVVHFGTASRENTFEHVLQSIIRGEATPPTRGRDATASAGPSTRAPCTRSVANLREHVIDSRVPHLPDSICGLSKCFIEYLASYHHDKFGIESVCLRINSCFPMPSDRRMFATWLSFADLVRVVEKALCVPRVGFTVAYGISDNREMPVSNRHAAHLGFVPQDSSEPYREKAEAATRGGDPDDPAVKFIGGSFCASGHFEDSWRAARRCGGAPRPRPEGSTSRQGRRAASGPGTPRGRPGGNSPRAEGKRSQETLAGAGTPRVPRFGQGSAVCIE